MPARSKRGILQIKSSLAYDNLGLSPYRVQPLLAVNIGTFGTFVLIKFGGPTGIFFCLDIMDVHVHVM